MLGEICSRPDGLDGHAAEAWYRGALALAEKLGMRPFVAHTHLGLGALYCLTDSRQDALAHLTAAAALYREMGMPFWLAKAEDRLSGVAAHRT